MPQMFNKLDNRSKSSVISCSTISDIRQNAWLFPLESGNEYTNQYAKSSFSEEEERDSLK